MKTKIDDLSSYIYYLRNMIVKHDNNIDSQYEQMVNTQTKIANHNAVINESIMNINTSSQNIVKGIQRSFDRLDKSVEVILKMKKQNESDRPAPNAKELVEIDKSIDAYLKSYTNINSYGDGIVKISDVQNPTARVILDMYPQYDPESLIQRVRVRTYAYWMSGEYIKYTKR